MFKYSLTFVILFSLLSASVHAVKVDGLYEMEVPVADQSDKERKSGLLTAFRLVLIKLTGDRQANGRAALSPLLSQAESYLQQYSYREVPSVHVSDTGESIESMQTLLWVRFDELNLNKALRALGVSVWGRERPSTLVWLAVGDENGRRLVSSDEMPEYFESLQLRAEHRGVALVFPLLDLDDNAAVRASDVWGGFRQPVLAASRRYNADSILTVTMESPVEGFWEARWTAYIDNQMANWNSESDLDRAALEEGVDNLADILAVRFARIRDFAGASDVSLAVADIFNASQYADVLKYLSALNTVSDVEVLELESGQVTFLLTAHGGEVAVTQAIELGRMLAPINGRADVNYRLLP